MCGETSTLRRARGVQLRSLLLQAAFAGASTREVRVGSIAPLAARYCDVRPPRKQTSKRTFLIDRFVPQTEIYTLGVKRIPPEIFAVIKALCGSIDGAAFAR